MFIYLAVFLVFAILLAAYYHGVFAPVTTKDSDLQTATAIFRNLQCPYQKVKKAYARIIKQARTKPIIAILLAAKKIVPFGVYYDDPHALRDPALARSSIGLYINEENFESLESG